MIVYDMIFFNMIFKKKIEYSTVKGHIGLSMTFFLIIYLTCITLLVVYSICIISNKIGINNILFLLSYGVCVGIKKIVNLLDKDMNKSYSLSLSISLLIILQYISLLTILRSFSLSIVNYIIIFFHC
jgi:hypothetical protein